MSIGAINIAECELAADCAKRYIDGELTAIEYLQALRALKERADECRRELPAAERSIDDEAHR